MSLASHVFGRHEEGSGIAQRGVRGGENVCHDTRGDFDFESSEVGL